MKKQICALFDFQPRNWISLRTHSTKQYLPRPGLRLLRRAERSSQRRLFLFLYKKHLGALELLTIILTSLLVSCCSRDNSLPALSTTLFTTQTPVLFSQETPTPIWPELLNRTPVAWTTPLPDPVHTTIDGTYAKFDPSEILDIHCRRCPDWVPEGGSWRLYLDKGIFRVYYEVTGWRSLGSFSLAGDKIYFFNDPYCNLEVGMYRWYLKDGALTFELIQDECAIKMRAANLTRQSWLSCLPPNQEAAVSDHWLKPPGCEWK